MTDEETLSLINNLADLVKTVKEITDTQEQIIKLLDERVQRLESDLAEVWRKQL